MIHSIVDTAQRSYRFQLEFRKKYFLTFPVVHCRSVHEYNLFSKCFFALKLNSFAMLLSIGWRQYARVKIFFHSLFCFSRLLLQLSLLYHTGFDRFIWHVTYSCLIHVNAAVRSVCQRNGKHMYVVYICHCIVPSSSSKWNFRWGFGGCIIPLAETICTMLCLLTHFNDTGNRAAVAKHRTRTNEIMHTYIHTYTRITHVTRTTHSFFMCSSTGTIHRHQIFRSIISWNDVERPLQISRTLNKSIPEHLLNRNTHTDTYILKSVICDLRLIHIKTIEFPCIEPRIVLYSVIHNKLTMRCDFMWDFIWRYLAHTHIPFPSRPIYQKIHKSKLLQKKGNKLTV